MARQFKLKTDEKGIPVLEGGNPVYTNLETNEDEMIDVNQLFLHISDLGKEAKKRRETNKTLMEKLRAIEEVGVPIEELPTLISKVKDVQPKVPSEVELIRKQWADEKALLERQLKEKEAHIEKSVIMNAFSTSPHFTGANAKTILPPAVAYKVFADKFKLDNEERKVVAVNSKGEPIYSRKNPELLASFEEALDMFLQEDEYKDLIKFNGAAGSGSAPGASSGINSQASVIAQATLEAQRTGDVSGLIKSKIQ